MVNCQLYFMSWTDNSPKAFLMGTVSLSVPDHVTINPRLRILYRDDPALIRVIPEWGRNRDNPASRHRDDPAFRHCDDPASNNGNHKDYCLSHVLIIINISINYCSLVVYNISFAKWKWSRNKPIKNKRPFNVCKLNYHPVIGFNCECWGKCSRSMNIKLLLTCATVTKILTPAFKRFLLLTAQISS